MHITGIETRTIGGEPCGSITYGAGVAFAQSFRKVWWFDEDANDNDRPRPRRLIYRCCVCGAPAVREMVVGSMRGSAASLRDESFWFCSIHTPD